MMEGIFGYMRGVAECRGLECKGEVEGQMLWLYSPEHKVDMVLAWDPFDSSFVGGIVFPELVRLTPEWVGMYAEFADTGCWSPKGPHVAYSWRWPDMSPGTIVDSLMDFCGVRN